MLKNYEKDQFLRKKLKDRNLFVCVINAKFFIIIYNSTLRTCGNNDIIEYVIQNKIKT